MDYVVDNSSYKWLEYKPEIIKDLSKKFFFEW